MPTLSSQRSSQPTISFSATSSTTKADARLTSIFGSKEDHHEALQCFLIDIVSMCVDNSEKHRLNLSGSQHKGYSQHFAAVTKHVEQRINGICRESEETLPTLFRSKGCVSRDHHEQPQGSKRNSTTIKDERLTSIFGSKESPRKTPVFFNRHCLNVCEQIRKTQAEPQWIVAQRLLSALTIPGFT